MNRKEDLLIYGHVIYFFYGKDVSFEWNKSLKGVRTSKYGFESGGGVGGVGGCERFGGLW